MKDSPNTRPWAIVGVGALTKVGAHVTPPTNSRPKHDARETKPLPHKLVLVSLPGGKQETAIWNGESWRGALNREIEPVTWQEMPERV